VCINAQPSRIKVNTVSKMMMKISNRLAAWANVVSHYMHKNVHT